MRKHSAFSTQPVRLSVAVKEIKNLTAKIAENADLPLALSGIG